MKTASLQSSHLIATLVLAVMLGLFLAMYVTSAPEARCARETECARETGCARETVDVSLLKLI